MTHVDDIGGVTIRPMQAIPVGKISHRSPTERARNGALPPRRRLDYTHLEML